ncbi:hypothetical protein [Luedemannella helvata]|uniref:Uncharacterized protein n=1 Tax=Luedemannella helvata TaxID=349315 RepID=A0ABN2L6R5_9ACTN
MTDLEEIARNIPLVTDRLMIQLGNDIRGVNIKAVKEEKKGFFSRLWDTIKGSPDQRHIDATLAKNQRRIVKWATEMTEHQRVTNLALTEFAHALGEVRDMAWAAQRTADLARSEVRELAEIVGRAIDTINTRLDEHQWRLDDHDRQLASHRNVLEDHEARLQDLDRRQLRVELWQAGWQEFDDAVRRWEDHGAYRSLPWIVQIVLLAREIASGDAGLHAYVTSDNSYQLRLEQRILASSTTPQWIGRKSLERILNEAVEALPTDDHRQLVAELLGAGVPADDAIPETPLAGALRRAMELRQLPAANRPESVGVVALSNSPYIQGGLTVRDAVRYAVEEQVTAVRQRRETLQKRRTR